MCCFFDWQHLVKTGLNLSCLCVSIFGTETFTVKGAFIFEVDNMNSLWQGTCLQHMTKLGHHLVFFLMEKGRCLFEAGVYFL